MCKMLFIGTQDILQVIPFDEDKPDFHIEELTGELLQVRQVFNNKNVYFVGTSRGCSCDFGVNNNQSRNSTGEHVALIQKVLKTFRGMAGALRDWQQKQRKKIRTQEVDKKRFLLETLKLLNLIETQTQKGNPVETYCVWAGDYEALPEVSEIIDAAQENLKERFEVAEKVFTTFT